MVLLSTLYITILSIFLFQFSEKNGFLSVNGCFIQGTDSGYCTLDSLDPIWRETNMPYCGRVVKYPVCIPKRQVLPPTREFPEGRWFNYTVYNKDQWVRHSAEAHIDERRRLERNGTLHRRNENEYGDPGRIKRRFYKRPDCTYAFRNLFCYTNFPRCDPDRDLSLPTCRSACENFFKACLYVRDLWRCGKSKYFNGYFPEAPSIGPDGNLTYLRDYFPGQPWRKNKFNRRGSEIPICTPSIRGDAGGRGQSMSLTLLLSLVLGLATFFLFSS